MAISKRDAMSLAVRYGAYREATRDCDDNAIACWGSCLHETQQRIGVYVVPTHLLDASVQYAIERLDRAKAKPAFDAAAVDAAYEAMGDIAAD